MLLYGVTGIQFSWFCLPRILPTIFSNGSQVFSLRNHPSHLSVPVVGSRFRHPTQMWLKRNGDWFRDGDMTPATDIQTGTFATTKDNEVIRSWAWSCWGEVTEPDFLDPEFVCLFVEYTQANIFCFQLHLVSVELWFYNPVSWVLQSQPVIVKVKAYDINLLSC